MWNRSKDILNLPVRTASEGSCTLLAQRREVSGMLLGRYQGEDDRTAACPKKKENLRSHLLQNILLISATGRKKTSRKQNLPTGSSW